MAGSSSVVTIAESSKSPNPTSLYRIDVTYTADDTDGSIPDVTTESLAGLICGVTHAPGGTAATTLFDIVAEDVNGVDMLCNAGLNIVTTADMQRVPYPDSASYGPFPFVGQLTFKFTNNAVNDATGVFSVFVMQDAYAH